MAGVLAWHRQAWRRQAWHRQAWRRWARGARGVETPADGLTISILLVHGLTNSILDAPTARPPSADYHMAVTLECYTSVARVEEHVLKKVTHVK